MGSRPFPVRSLLAALVGLSAILAVEGCTVGPNYVKPDTPAPAKWSEESGAVAPVTADLSRWWTVFNDPELDSLIQRAVASNKDLKIAEARVREARAQRGVVSADLYPNVNASGTYVYSKESENKIEGAQIAISPQELFQVGFDASWEIDIFGGTRRAVEAATADIAAREEARRDTLVTLLSEVARNYMVLRGNQLRLSIAERNIQSQRKTVELTVARFEAGLSSELDVAQAKTQLASTESRVPGMETAIRQAIHQLAVLLGREPGSLLPELLEEAPIPPVPPDVPVGLPSELLRRRPDVRRAERELAAATARIGVATADLFPKFSLTGAAGFQSLDISKVAAVESGYWALGPTIVWPIFDAGRIRSNIAVQNARQEQALVAYEKAVLVSFQDVENALVAYSKEQATRLSLMEAVKASQRAFDISNELYAKGLADFLNVLESQRALYLTQDELAQSEQRVSGNLVALYKALGGGWDIVTQ